MDILNTLPTIDFADNETDCCPRLHPENWDEKIFNFQDELFAMASSKSFMYMPVNFGKMMTKSQKSIDAADAKDPERYLILSQDVSKWRADHYFKVTKDVPGMKMVKMNGNFMTKAYSAEYREIPNLIKQFTEYVENCGKTYSELFIFYTTCPKCAKHYGNNYMVLFGKI